MTATHLIGIALITSPLWMAIVLAGLEGRSYHRKD